MDNSNNKCASNKRTPINRRQFLKTAGQTSGLLSALVVSGHSLAARSVLGLNDENLALKVDLDRDAMNAIEPSIKANFGSGFRILSCQQRANQTYAVIEHLENHYSIASVDQQNWHIIQSTEI